MYKFSDFIYMFVSFCAVLNNSFTYYICYYFGNHQ